MRMDLFKSRYENFDELYDYCYRVAGTVALMSVPVMGVDKNYKVGGRGVWGVGVGGLEGLYGAGRGLCVLRGARGGGGRRGLGGRACRKARVIIRPPLPVPVLGPLIPATHPCLPPACTACLYRLYCPAGPPGAGIPRRPGPGHRQPAHQHPAGRGGGRRAAQPHLRAPG